MRSGPSTFTFRPRSGRPRRPADESAWLGAFRELQGYGAQVRVLHGEHPVYIHAKLIEVDGTRVFLGSENLSSTSLERDRELGITVTTPSIVSSVIGTFGRDFAAGATPTGA
jgi:phosphatidylserine/phosphatidylglycerophosphate/cardiolipin synthase-like enzyme